MNPSSQKPILIIALILVVGTLLLGNQNSSAESELLIFRQSWGAEGGRFRTLTDIAVALDSTIYVADIEYSRITVITRNRDFLVWGSDGQFKSPSGVDVDPWGNVFVVENGNDRVQKLTSGGTQLTQWGSAGSGPGQFDGPSRVATDGNGNVYVLDNGNERVQKFSNSGAYLNQWNANGSLIGATGLDVDANGVNYVSTTNGRILKFDALGNKLLEWTAVNYSGNSGTDVAVDDNGFVYLILGETGQIQKFSSTGTYLMTVGSMGSASGEYRFPSGIASGYERNGNAALFVADTGNNRVQMLTPDGEFLTEWGPEGAYSGSCNVSFNRVWISRMAADSKFLYLTGGEDSELIQTCTHDGSLLFTWGGSEQIGQIGDFASDSNGNVYVADMVQKRIHKYDVDGNYLMGWGSQGSGSGQFNYPFHIVVDQRTNNIYVADSGYFGGNERIQKFDSNGNYLLEWGSPGTGPGEFISILGLVVDSQGNVYASDSNRRIQKFTSNGDFILQWGESGSGPGQFYSVYMALAIDSNDHIYVTDSENHRIQKFDTSGTFLGELGGFGYGASEFSSPYDVAVDDQDNVFVYEFHGGRLQKFSQTSPPPDPTTGLMQNGSFESAPLLNEWTYGGNLNVSRDTHAYNGNYAVLLGQSVAQTSQGQGTAWVYQTINVDPTWERPILSFSYNMYVNDIVDYSDFFVSVQDGLGLNHLATILRDGYQPCASGVAPYAGTSLGWRTASYDLSAFKGQHIRLVFSNRNLWPNSWGIWTYVDDVRVADAGALPTPPGAERIYLPIINNQRCDAVSETSLNTGSSNLNFLRPAKP